jgi:uncharacterized damage-inducible protein DinB
MDERLREALWGQYGAAIDMLENALRDCPPKVWGDRPGYHAFWCIAYHTLFYLDYYASQTTEGFLPPAPFGLTELDPEGALPDRVFSKEELLGYLAHGREKVRARIAGMTAEEAARPRRLGTRAEGTELELLLYTLRHVQHHAAQLNLLLRQGIDAAPGWVSRTKHPLDRG